jgi:hypothetical protein
MSTQRSILRLFVLLTLSSLVVLAGAKRAEAQGTVQIVLTLSKNTVTADGVDSIQMTATVTNMMTPSASVGGAGLLRC